MTTHSIGITRTARAFAFHAKTRLLESTGTRTSAERVARESLDNLGCGIGYADHALPSGNDECAARAARADRKACNAHGEHKNGPPLNLITVRTRGAEFDLRDRYAVERRRKSAVEGS
jgi:hypothetical protein